MWNLKQGISITLPTTLNFGFGIKWVLAKSEWKAEEDSLSYEPITDIISTPNAKQTWVYLTLDNGNTITTTDDLRC
jgi:hypothetical protein